MGRISKDENYLLDKIREKTQEYSELNSQSDLVVIIKDIHFVLTKPINVVATGLEIKFINCSFDGHRIDFVISELQEILNSIEFRDCRINCNLFIKESTLYNLSFNNVNLKSESHLHISSCIIHRISMSNNTGTLNKFGFVVFNYNRNINFCDIGMYHFQSLFFNGSEFKNSFNLIGNRIDKLNLNRCNFQRNFIIRRNVINGFTKINYCNFGEFDAENTNFTSGLAFEDITYTGRFDFSIVKSILSNILFENCTFEKTANFDNSIFNSLHFKSIEFQEIASFSNLKCINYIEFGTTYFAKIGFFENLNIGNIDRLNIHSIRTIKGQLSKTENKIDYLKYNALEQRKKFHQLNLKDADYYILWLNKVSNDFGRNWFTGVKFTLKTSIFFFIILILVNSFINSEYPLKFNFNYAFAGASQILSEYLKFTFSLGFSDDTFASNGFLYLIFILSKIFIGYGIYQTITAFRKYGRI